MNFAAVLLTLIVGAGVWQPLPRAAHGISDRMTAVEVTTNAAGEDEYLWVGTEAGALHRYDLRTDRWFSPAAPRQNPGALLDLGYDDRFLWIGTVGGLFRFDRRADRWMDRSDSLSGQGPIVLRVGIDMASRKSGAEGLSSNRYVWSLSPQVSYPSALLSVRSAAGISILDQWYNKTIPINLTGGLSELDPQDAVLEGNLLRIAGTSGLHSIMLTAQNSLSTSAFLSGGSSRLYALALDSAHVWAGGRGEVYMLEKSSDGRDRLVQRHVLTESPEGHIRKILATANFVIFGTENDGAYAWDRQNDRWGRVPPEFIARSVDDLVATSNGFVAASTEGGLHSKLVRYWVGEPGSGPAARERTVASALTGNVTVSSSYLRSAEKPLAQILESISAEALLNCIATAVNESASIESSRLRPETRSLLGRFQSYGERNVEIVDPASVIVTVELGKTIVSAPSLIGLSGIDRESHGRAVEERTFQWTIRRAVFGADCTLEELE